jgi:hypothetical protein
MNINLVPYDIHSIYLTHTQSEKITNTKIDLSSNTFYTLTITTTNSKADTAISNQTAKDLHNCKDGKHLHIWIKKLE